MNVSLRECWILASNLRLSAQSPDWTIEPTIHAIVIETVRVPESERRQGKFKAFVKSLCDDTRFEMVVVEGVQNPILANALTRWGWQCDWATMDFYWRRAEAVQREERDEQHTRGA